MDNRWFGNYNFAPGSYQVGFGTNDLANHLYYNSDDIARSVYADSRALWEREDSAYQRMVEDMRKAGLNPWLGVSSGGAATGSNNPSMDSLTSLISVLGGLLDTESTYTQSSSRLVNNLTNLLYGALGAVGRMF